MNLVYLNKYETNHPWGAETFMNAAFSELDVEIHNVDYVNHAFGVTNELKKLNLGAFNGSLVQRGTGYNIPRSVIQLLPRPRILMITELVKRIMVQSYLWDSELFDFFHVRTPECKHFLQENHAIPEEKLDILLSGFDPTLFYPVTHKKDIEILFVGTLTERRSKIIDQLNLTFGNKLMVTSAFGTALNGLINRSKIVLNIHGSEALDTETRVFEVLGARGFLISETLSEESPFTTEVDLIECVSIDEMVKKIRYFLSKDQDPVRNEISNSGYRHVVDKHTYLSRAIQVKSKIEAIRETKDYVPISQPSLIRPQLDEKLSYLANALMTPLIRIYHKIRTA